MFNLLLKILNYKSKLTLANYVTVHDNSKINYRKIHVKNGCRLDVGSNSIIEAVVSFDRENAKVSIGNRTFIGTSNIVCANRITIGDDVLISWGCTIVDHNSHSLVWEDRKDDVINWMDGRKEWQHVKVSPVKIGNKAWLGFNSIVLKGVTIGEGSIVAAGSVVTKDVPPFVVVAGNPAKIVRNLAPDESDTPVRS